MIQEFTDDQIARIKALGMCQSIGAMLGDIVPRKGTEVSVDGFVKEYEEQARYAARIFFDNEDLWKCIAEIWAQTDIDILRDVMCFTDRDTALNEMFGW